MRVVGIDLAAKPENSTGFCILDEKSSQTKVLHSNEDILAEVEKERPECIAIDAPFWLPKSGAKLMPWRPSEQLLIKRGFRPISPMLPTMQMLTMRASFLVKTLRDKGFNVIEVFSKASEQILGLSKEARKNEHEYDALICALTAKAFLEGNYEDLEGIIIPK